MFSHSVHYANDQVFLPVGTKGNTMKAHRWERFYAYVILKFNQEGLLLILIHVQRWMNSVKALGVPWASGSRILRGFHRFKRP